MDDIFDENGISKIDGKIIVHNYHYETGVYTGSTEIGLVKNFGIPAQSTIVSPIENPQGVNRWDGTQWIDDVAYGDALRVEERKEIIEKTVEDLHKQLAKLTLKQSVNRITEDEDLLRIKIINQLIDLDEFDVEDLTKEIPTF